MPKTVAIGIITCGRPQGLARLLDSLALQQVAGTMRDYFIIVVDNEPSTNTEAITQNARQLYGLNIRYFREQKRGIPVARNLTVREALNAGSSALIFLDDDEEAPPEWLGALLKFWQETGADIITGPVKAILPPEAPAWALKSGAYDKASANARGTPIKRAFTNNTLVSSRVLETLGDRFNMIFRYTGSSDLHYFMLARKAGFKILWCPEAFMTEHIPISRLKYGWILKRGFRSGAGDTIARRLIDPKIKTILHVLILSGGRTVVGMAQILLVPLTGWRGWIIGSRRIASGIGSFLGLFGINYKEYKRIHRD